MTRTDPKRTPFSPFAAALLLILVAWGSAAADFRAEHRLRVRLQPDLQRLEGDDRLRIAPGPGSEPLILTLDPRAEIHSLTLDGAPQPLQREGRRLVLARPPDAGGRPLELQVIYRARYDDPAPSQPVNTDNPGYGVTGTITPDGVLLLGGAGWYPAVTGARESLVVEIEAPAGMRAVTSGRALGAVTSSGKTVSRWEVAQVPEPLALAAGRYAVTERSAGGITIATYFLPGNRHLAPSYLDAAARYLALYADLFGPYPFPQFAVVENFFPTGYGFPSFTLLGSRVLALPFILDTSLGHEIAHCWWGNGVLVDAAEGNWSEGLTSYVAEHLYAERRGPDEARAHRRQLLRNYADLVAPGDDFPLTRFHSRVSPATKAVGYDKAALVFHMLRRRVGDALFWPTLARLYKERLFRPTAWSDFQRAFEDASGQDLQPFFRQWLSRPGAPRIRLDGVRLAPEPGGFRLTGTVVQEGPVYALDLSLAAIGADGAEETRTLALAEPRMAFAWSLPFAPLRLEADPDGDLFRRLEPAEIPPAVNRLRGASGVVMAVVEGFPGAARGVLLEGLGLKPLETVHAEDLALERWRHRDLLVLGLPAAGPLRAAVHRELSSRGASWDEPPGQTPETGDARFAVLPHPLDPARIMAVYDGRSAAALLRAAAKIPHYGRYSYLVFHQGTNIAKGVWPARESPLVVHFTSPNSWKEPAP
jgi:hypothetical protein